MTKALLDEPTERDYTSEIAQIALIAVNAMQDNIGVSVEIVATVIAARIVDKFPDLSLSSASQEPVVDDDALNYEELSILHGQQVTITFKDRNDAFDLFNELRDRGLQAKAPDR